MKSAQEHLTGGDDLNCDDRRRAFGKVPSHQTCSLNIRGDDDEGRRGREGERGVKGGSKVSTQ